MTAARRAPGSSIGLLVLALVPSILILAATVYCWQRVMRMEADQRTAAAQSELGWVMLELEKSLDRHTDAIRAVADSVAALGDSAMRAAAPLVQASDLQLRAVALLDSGLAVRNSAPFDARMLPTFAPDDDDARALTLRDALLKAMSPDVVVTPSVDLAARGRQILFAARVGPAARPRGYVVGVARARDLFDAALDRTRKRGYEVSIGEGGIPLYGPLDPESLIGSRYAGESAITNGPVLWGVRLWPSEDTIRHTDSCGAWAVLLFGTALGFCVGFLILLAAERSTGHETSGDPADEPEEPDEADRPALEIVRNESDPT